MYEVVGRRKIREALSVAPADGGGEGEDIHVHIHDAEPESVSLNGPRASVGPMPETIGPPSSGGPWEQTPGTLISVFKPANIGEFIVARKSGDGLSVWRRGRDGETFAAEFGPGHVATRDRAGTVRIYRKDALPEFPGPRERNPERPAGFERETSGELELTRHGTEADRRRDGEEESQRWLESHDIEKFTSGEAHEDAEEPEDWREGAERLATFSPRSKYDVRRFRDKHRSGMHILHDDGRPAASFHDDNEHEHLVVPSKTDDALHVYRRPRRDRRPRRSRDANASTRASSIGLQATIDAMWARPENQPPYMAGTAPAPVRDAAPRRIRSVADLERAADALWRREK